MKKTIGYWKKKFKDCEKKGKERSKCEVKVRGEYREVLSGRLSKMGDETHNFLARADLGNRRLFKDKTIKEVAEEFGLIEDLSNKF